MSATKTPTKKATTKKAAKKKTAKKATAKKKTGASGEQKMLTEVGPKNAATLRKHAGLYRRACAARCRLAWRFLPLSTEEAKHKANLLQAVRAAKLRADDEGVIRCSVQGDNGRPITIKVAPRGELIQVKVSEADDD